MDAQISSGGSDGMETEPSPPKTVFLEKGRRKVRLYVNDILYVEPDGSHGVQIILESGSVNFPAGVRLAVLSDG